MRGRRSRTAGSDPGSRFLFRGLLDADKIRSRREAGDRAGHGKPI